MDYVVPRDELVFPRIEAHSMAGQRQKRAPNVTRIKQSIRILGRILDSRRFRHYEVLSLVFSWMEVE